MLDAVERAAGAMPAPPNKPTWRQEARFQIQGVSQSQQNLAYSITSSVRVSTAWRDGEIEWWRRR